MPNTLTCFIRTGRPLPFRYTFLRRCAPLLLGGLIACASGQEIPPPGGPPDEQPPVIRESVPAEGTINFNERTVRITFDEYLNEGSVAEQLVITPIPERTPEIDWSGRTLEIRFQEPLRENRTYAITLGAGIQDLSGNRLGTPYTLRFSTGPVIDSGRIAGQIAGKGDRDVFIFAYTVPDDAATFGDTLTPEETAPDFIAPVGDNGAYSLEGLPPGRYRLFAVADEYTDRRYSPGVDAFGVATRDVEIDAGYGAVPPLSIRIMPAAIDMTPPQLFSASSLNNERTELRFSEPIDTVTVRPENFRLTVNGTATPIVAAWRSPRNSIAVQLAHAPLPAGGAAEVEAVALTDTVGLTIADTARRATFTTTARRDSLAPALQPVPGIEKGYRMGDTLTVAFDEGVEFDESDGAMTLTDTASGTALRFRLVRRSAAEFSAVPADSAFKGVSGILSIDLGAFRDFGGNRTDTVWRQSATIRPTPQRGSLQGVLRDTLAPNTPHVILLESTEEKRVFRVRLRGTGSWEIKDIPSGNYNLSAFRDDDRDGEYDYGSISPYRPGEVFAERPGGIQVRPRWTTTEVNIDF